MWAPEERGGPVGWYGLGPIVRPSLSLSLFRSAKPCVPAAAMAVKTMPTPMLTSTGRSHRWRHDRLLDPAQRMAVSVLDHHHHGWGEYGVVCHLGRRDECRVSVLCTECCSERASRHLEGKGQASCVLSGQGLENKICTSGLMMKSIGKEASVPTHAPSLRVITIPVLSLSAPRPSDPHCNCTTPLTIHTFAPCPCPSHSLHPPRPPRLNHLHPLRLALLHRLRTRSLPRLSTHILPPLPTTIHQPRLRHVLPVLFIHLRPDLPVSGGDPAVAWPGAVCARGAV